MKTKRIVMVALANFLIALGVAFLKLSSFGTDPYSSMNMVIGRLLGIGYGNWMVVINCLLAVPCLIYKRDSFGTGALINMFLVGYFVEFHVFWLDGLGFTVERFSGLLAWRIFFLILGVFVLCLFVAFYMECDLGAAPYDVLGDVVELLSKGKISFRVFRVSTDLFCVAVAYLLHGVVGIATFAVAFCTGPLVDYFRKHVARPMLKS